MDAMDITNVQTSPVERENKIVKEDYVEEAVDSVSNEEIDVSFEDLMCSMFEEVMNKKEVSINDKLENLDVETEVLLNGEINVDEDVDSLIRMAQKKDVLVNELKNEAPTLPLINEDFVVQEEEIPVIEYELEVSTEKVKDKKETKKEEAVKEEKEEIVEMLPKEEVKHVVPLAKPKNESIQKVEPKKEKEDDVDIEMVDNLSAQKTKKMPKKLPITVEDLRTVPEAQTGETVSEEGEASAFNGDSSFGDRESFSTSSTSNTSNQKAENVENAKGNQFSSILAEQIKANSAELVQRGKIVLRDGNVGEIRLQLKPAHLGIVRINLKMTGDKKMQGEVTVSSQEAYNAFEDSMEELVASFKNAGFDTSSFNLNWKGGREEVVREDLKDKYFSPEKTMLTLREKLNVTENIYKFGQAENVNVLA
ncbi:MAG: flagellar hook-length control protein FliK [Treponema sp.]